MFEEFITGLVGRYICQEELNKPEKERRYILINYAKEPNSYIWRSYSGEKWTLVDYGDKNNLQVIGCASHPDYTLAKIIRLSNKIQKVIGPNKQLFEKSGSDLYNILGYYESTSNKHASHKDKNLGNDSGYARIDLDPNERKYIWKNKGGEKWHMSESGDDGFLLVDDDCKYKKLKGFEKMKIMRSKKHKCVKGVMGVGEVFFEKVSHRMCNKI